MTTRTFDDYARSGEIEAIVFKKDAPAEPYVEGLLAYDQATKTHIALNDIDNTTLNIGEEQRIRIINKTGSQISDGKPVRQDGVDAITKLPKIQLAQADTLIGARILGVTTHMILDGEEGIITTFGPVRGLDTSLLTAGIPVYLSDTIPGGLTVTPPSIVTQVGGITVSDAIDGILFVKIFNVIALPTLFGILQDIPDTYDLTTSYQNLDNYQIEDAVTLDLDKLLGTITVPNDGRYRGSFSITMTVPTSISTRSITVQAWDTTNSISLLEYAIPVPRDTTELSRSMSIPFSVIANSDIVMRIKSDVAITGVVIGSISYDIESISLT